MTTVRDVLVDAERRLTAAGVPSASADAALIVSSVLERPKSALYLHDEIPTEQRIRIERLITQRSSRIPVQHLLGWAPFRHLELSVGPGVFIPRPETELVAEAVIRSAGGGVVVDLSSGSGAVAIAIATEADAVDVHAVELSSDALPWLERNVAAYADRIATANSRIVTYLADACSAAEPGAPLARLAGTVDAVVSNPPYIPDAMVPRDPEVRDHEPHLALFGGSDGLDVVRGIARTAAILLKPGGLLVVEHADVQGADAGERGVPGVLLGMVADDATACDFDVPPGTHIWTDVHDRPDLNGLPRFTMARKWSGMR